MGKTTAFNRTFMYCLKFNLSTAVWFCIIVLKLFITKLLYLDSQTGKFYSLSFKVTVRLCKSKNHELWNLINFAVSLFLPRYCFAALYTVEMALKVIARGFVLHSYAYLRDPWNCLDFIVVILG